VGKPLSSWWKSYFHTAHSVGIHYLLSANEVTVEDLQYTGRIEILTVAESVNELEHFEERFIRCVCRPFSREARQ
jgi:hypothetical protein